MHVLLDVFLAFHIIGIAALLGGFLTQIKGLGEGTARFNKAMLHGALTMLVTGAVMVGLSQADGHPVDNTKIGIKLVVLIVILGIVYVKRDTEAGSATGKRLFAAVGALTMVNIFIATIWN
jgi:uncharacterized membrane protein HdeD (DUF308 family)